jgi:hypothetical protein
MDIFTGKTAKILDQINKIINFHPAIMEQTSNFFSMEFLKTLIVHNLQMEEESTSVEYSMVKISLIKTISITMTIMEMRGKRMSILMKTVRLFHLQRKLKTLLTQYPVSNTKKKSKAAANNL